MENMNDHSLNWGYTMAKIAYVEDFKTWEEEFAFYYPIKVRFSETDMFGHLNNTVTFAYFELARIEYFKSLGFMQDWVSPTSETIPVVANLQCDYLKQIYFAEEINIYVKVHFIGNSSMDIHYLGKGKDEKPCLTGRGTFVQVSKSTGKGVPWTEEEKMLCKYPRNIT